MNSISNRKIKDKESIPTQAIYWSEAISLGNEEVDNQHKKLFELTNELIKHADADAHSEIINETLYELLQYVDTHFSDEEALMESINYPKLEEHKKLHRSFTKQIAMFCRDVVQGKATIAEELLAYLSHWLQHHTSQADQDYKNYL